MVVNYHVLEYHKKVKGFVKDLLDVAAADVKDGFKREIIPIRAVERYNVLTYVYYNLPDPSE